MEVHIGWWFIPAVISFVCLAMMFRPGERGGGGWYNFDLTPVFRLLWLIPALASWVVYFAIVLMFQYFGDK